MKNLWGKIGAVQSEIRRVAKGGTNSMQHYKFATESDIKAELRPLLTKHGLAVMASVVPGSVVSETLENDKRAERVSLMMEIRIVSAQDEPADALGVTIHSAGSAVDYSDKATNKAQTAAIKFGLIAAFLIETGDDPDGDDPRPTGKSDKRQADHSYTVYTESAVADAYRLGKEAASAKPKPTAGGVLAPDTTKIWTHPDPPTQVQKDDLRALYKKNNLTRETADQEAIRASLEHGLMGVQTMFDISSPVADVLIERWKNPGERKPKKKPLEPFKDAENEPDPQF